MRPPGDPSHAAVVGLEELLLLVLLRAEEDPDAERWK